MSEGTVRPLRRAAPGAAAVAARVLADIDHLIAVIGQALQAEIPEYAAMSAAAMTEDVLPVTRRVVTTFFDTVVAGRELDARAMRGFEDSGRRRLEMGVPLESMLHAYRIAGRVTWNAVVSAVAPGEERLLGELAAGWIGYIDLASSAVARAYMTASSDRLRHLDARRRELLEALLSADDLAEVASVSLRFSTVLASAYVPVLVGGADVAVHIDKLLGAAPTGTLGGHRGHRVLLLVPDPAGDLARLRAAGQDSVLAYGRPAAPGAALLTEVRHVESLLETAIAGGTRAGAYGPDDLLVEQLLLGNERVGDALRRRVRDALHARDATGVLVSTLRAYLETGSVPEAARREVVHPNTVAYRLARVREITGLDPRVPSASALLVLGLTATGDHR